MTRKNKIAPEALQALNNFKMEMSDELGIHIDNSMTRSEYPAYMNKFNSKDKNNKNLKSKMHNHDIY
ncbi:MAG: small, acid-soluble spore protein, alpha/beta type [Sedimentibacter sp.]